MLNGWKTHGFAGALVLKGFVALGTGATADGPALEPVTFDNLEQQLERVAAGAPSQQQNRSSALNDILLGGGLSALRSGVKRERL